MPPQRRVVVETTPFPTTVTIFGDLADAVLVYVTYHDVGLNHRWCFGKLLSQMNGSNMLERVRRPVSSLRRTRTPAVPRRARCARRARRTPTPAPATVRSPW